MLGSPPSRLPQNEPANKGISRTQLLTAEHLIGIVVGYDVEQCVIQMFVGNRGARMDFFSAFRLEGTRDNTTAHYVCRECIRLCLN